MDKAKKTALSCLAGVLYAVVPVMLVRWLIRNLSDLFAHLAENLKIDPQVCAQIIQVLAQLKTASLHSPWLLAAMIGVGMGILHWVLSGRKWVWFLLVTLLPLTIAVLWFTGVNGIHLGALLGQLLPLLPELL